MNGFSRKITFTEAGEVGAQRAGRLGIARQIQ